MKEQAIKKGYVDRFKSFVDRFKSPSDLIRAIETYKEYGTIDVSGIKEYLELILRIFDLK